MEKYGVAPAVWEAMTALDRRRLCSRKWKKDHPDKVAEGKRLYARRHKDVISAKNQRYYFRHRERIRAAQLRWRQALRAQYVQRPAIGEALRTALTHNALYAAALKAVPARLPRHVRDDVISELVLAAIERRIDPADIAKEAPNFVRAYWREFGHLKLVSLDAPIKPGSTATYMDFLEAAE